MLKIIPSQDLVCMDDLARSFGFRVDLAYARADNTLFGERIYRKNAKLYLHRTLADVVCRAAADCQKTFDARMILYDGLRTKNAQERMMHTNRVRENPHWLQEPRLLSPPGMGGHPRGMAIDIGLESLSGELLDMGTPFDSLTLEAHRGHPHLSEAVKQNRRKLDISMQNAAEALHIPLLPLPQEWWDFRMPPETYNQFKPLSDHDLPEEMRLLG